MVITTIQRRNLSICRLYFRNVQIEESPIESCYEVPHSSILHPIDLNGNSIAKVGDVKDLLKIYRNGDVEIEKNVGKVVLDGSENWVIMTDGELKYFRLYDSLVVKCDWNERVEGIMSNCFEKTNFLEIFNNPTKTGIFPVGVVDNSICINYPTITTIDEFKNFLYKRLSEICLWQFR